MDEAERIERCARLSERIEAHFRRVHKDSMHDVPICNAQLSVASVGFRPCGDWAVGIIVTPWFMNVFAAPFATPVAAGPGETQRLALPNGEVDFLGAEIEGLGRLLSCSLFSPMDEFIDQPAALVTATAALDALLTPPAAKRETPKAHLDRRAFFRGAFSGRRGGADVLDETDA
ncbi:[NiFe]-hydrogenase assembly chaperone HybE [Rhodoblastus sp.]|uniref:[NiFe]-hydrogenase assembly chaperone HybE n=1 Tax=Rhodoblastus sp. TaxID=1962975 RepID=UPI002637620A|nr:[NiFe]-hydrogenase assembly chaperone HybE [Rhodoblastus sp.]